jgi:predicted PurR-regulated permease PerM
LDICEAMAGRDRTSSASAVALWILAAVATLFLLRAARTLFIPIALAVLVSYALEPVVAWLAGYRVPRMAGAAVVLLVILAATAWGAYSLRDDARELVEALPKAVQRAREIAASQLGSGAEASQQGASFLERGAGAILALAGNLVVIFFLVFFLLMSGNHVRNRIVEIAGPDAERRRTTARIIDEINTQIQRYLVVLLITAVIVAAATWIVLASMGVQHAAMWAILAGVFNSIPYFGPVVVCGGLFVVGLVQEGGMTQALQMSGAALVITSLEGWVLTPPLMGKAERMSALAVFLGLLLWTWVWGGWGTVLAVPMLVIIKSVADHVDRLKPVGRLMAP